MDSSDNTRPTPAGSAFHEAVFQNTATDPSSVLLVLIPDFSADLPFGDPDGVVWSPIGGALPQAGDRALVAESTDGSWWVVSWWSDAQTASNTQRAHAQATLHWPASSVYSDTLTIDHGLDGTPTAVHATASDGSAPFLFGCHCFNRTSTQFSVRGFFVTSPVGTAPPAGAQDLTISWSAEL